MEMNPRSTRLRDIVLVARGFLLATGILSAVFAWWVYGDQPSMSPAAMYQWIRLFYGSFAVSVAAWLGFGCTFAVRRRP